LKYVAVWTTNYVVKNATSHVVLSAIAGLDYLKSPDKASARLAATIPKEWGIKEVLWILPVYVF